VTHDVMRREAATEPERVNRGGMRVGAGTLLALGAVVLVAKQAWYRGVEVSAAGGFLHKVLGYSVYADRSTQMLYFRLNHAGAVHFMGLGLSLGCSSVLLAAPVVFITAMLAMTSRIPLSRLLAACVIVTGMVVSMNVLRLALIAWFVNAWGVKTGFGWAHSFFGTLLTLFGMSAAMGVYVLLVRGLGRFAPPLESAAA
jgi:exosortase/archaeosortase family protein